MQWTDDGFILGARRHGETSLILEVMTATRGRHLGLVKGGRSRRLQPLLQCGNDVQVTWRARLEEQLGFFSVEATRIRAADLMGSRSGLAGLNHIAGLLRLLAERDPHEDLFAKARQMIDSLDHRCGAPRMVRFELDVLAAVGYGLDLTACAATGRRDDLAYVSPRTGRAVSRDAGLAYHARLLVLPPFLVHEEEGDVSADDVQAGAALSAFFFLRDVYAPRGLVLPAARDAYFTRAEVPASDQ